MPIIPTPTLIAEGNERAIARAISWVENQHPQSMELLEQLEGNCPIVGVTGPPGAGKSSLVNALVLHWSSKGLKTAIVAVDPSSPFNLGSLLGDRLRMPGLFLDPKVFIRSLSARGSLGGLSASIIEVCDILKHAKFDRIIIETVGVGQSEIEIAGIADTTLVVTVPESGDEVQTMKSGVMEIADIFVINKADRKGAEETRRDLEQMLDLSDIGHDDWRPPILQTSAVSGEGVSELWNTVLAHREFIMASGKLTQRRSFRLREELRAIVERRLELRAREICSGEKWDGLEQQVLNHTVDPWAAADDMLKGIGA